MSKLEQCQLCDKFMDPRGLTSHMRSTHMILDWVKPIIPLIKNEGIICEFCNTLVKSRNHIVRCKNNPNRIIKIWTDEERKLLGIKKRIFNSNYWTIDKRKEHSDLMINVVKSNPDSYSKSNVSGRVKMYDVLCENEITQVKGTWELKVATWLNENNIKWTNSIKPYSYFWNNSWHLYFPDFYLPDHDLLIEVKGYEIDRDTCKWASVDKKLLIIKNSEIKNLTSFLQKNINSYGD